MGTAKQAGRSPWTMASRAANIRRVSRAEIMAKKKVAPDLKIQDASGLTDADWAQINKLRQALEQGGTSHVLSKEEAKFVFERGCNQLIVGSGQIGNVRLSPEAEAYFEKKDCKVLLQPTPDAIQVFNKSHAKKIGLFHVTC